YGVYPLDPPDRQLYTRILRNFFQVLFVFFRNDHRLDAATMGCKQLFLQATDRQHFAAQRDFAGHGDVRTHRNAGQGGNERGAHADAGTRAILGRGALRHVNVHVDVLMEVLLQAKGFRTAANDRHRRLDGLLHDVAELAGVNQLALAGHHRGLDGQQFTADLRPGKASHLADLILLLGAAETETAHAEIPFEVFRRHLHGRVLGLKQQLLDDLAADLRDLALKAAHARLAGVVPDDRPHRVLADLDLVPLQAVCLDLLGDEIAKRDIGLFILGVAGQADYFHSIQQRTGNVHRVRRRDEHHVGQVVIDLEVMVDEGGILFRVKHFQHGGGRIAAEIHRHLVDLVEQEQRVLHAHLGHVLDDLAGHRTDVG